MGSLPSKHNLADNLADIVENAERVRTYIEGMDRDAFERDGLKHDAVERCLERVCEAIYRLGDQAELLMPGHPWRDIRSMANRLRHAYDRINTEVIWNADLRNLPGLAADAKQALLRLEATAGEG